MTFPRLHVNSFTRMFLAFFFAFTVPVSTLALYMGHVGEIAGYRVEKPGDQLPMAAVLRAIPDISVFGQSQGVAGTTRVHITGRHAMGFHTLYVLPDKKTVFAGVPLAIDDGAEVDIEQIRSSLVAYSDTLRFLGAQIDQESTSNPGRIVSPTEHRLSRQPN